MVVIALLVRIDQVDVPALPGAVVKWTVTVMDKPFNSSIVVPYTQPELSSSISQYCLSVYITRVCVLPYSVVTDTFTSKVGLLKSNGATLKGDIHNKMYCIS